MALTSGHARRGSTAQRLLPIFLFLVSAEKSRQIGGEPCLPLRGKIRDLDPCSLTLTPLLLNGVLDELNGRLDLLGIKIVAPARPAKCCVDPAHHTLPQRCHYSPNSWTRSPL